MRFSCTLLTKLEKQTHTFANRLAKSGRGGGGGGGGGGGDGGCGVNDGYCARELWQRTKCLAFPAIVPMVKAQSLMIGYCWHQEISFA